MRTKLKPYFLSVIFLLLSAVGIFLFIKQRQPTYPQALCKDCNVILITMTNLHFDHMSLNGYFRPTTPNIDRLAESALVFDNAFGHASWTLPESISIYTSLYPFQHGVVNRSNGSTLPKNTITLVDILNKNGYQTAAFTGGNDYGTRYGLTSRFSVYQECLRNNIPGFNRPENYGHLDCTVPKALAWLKNNAKTKFFLQLQGFDAHCPFSQNGGKMYDKEYKSNIDYSHCLVNFNKADPTIKDGKKYYLVNYSASATKSLSEYISERDIQHLVAIYDESITDSDKAIATFLQEIKSMGLLENTIVIFTSEHGDVFGKYGRFMRGSLRGTFYDDALHIPLFIRLPKFAPKKIDGLVGQIDIMPTLLDILRLKSPSDISGKSLLPLIVNGQEVNGEVFAGLEFNPPLNNSFFFNKKNRIEAVRTKEWKLIKEDLFDNEKNISTVSYELFDIVNDKEELHNVAGDKKDILEGLLSKLDSLSKNVRRK